MNEDILTRSLPDGGPLYRETDLTQFVAEPWNAGSSLVFILAALFLVFRTKGLSEKFLFLKIASFILLIGGVGGTLYHAFRISKFFLFLDVAPIYVLVFGIACALWIRLSGNWKILLFILPFFILMDFLLFYAFPLKEQLKQHLSYVNMGSAAIIPLFGVLIREKFRNGVWALCAFAGYSLGLTFRILDANEPPLFSMGTHWLWHVTCAISSVLLMEFLARFFEKERFPSLT